ncbi:MAG: glucose-6-phosphate isomerase [Asgard group archaeon]|nr:glucose-6-phosphate isomerase [Asgard group archaeon]
MMIKMVKIDLSKYVPYDLVVDGETNLISSAGDIELNYNTRKLSAMKDVIYDVDWLNQQKEDHELYYMYRDFTRAEDKELFQEHAIRFDITIIPPMFLGREFIKTAGHFHPLIEKKMSYPEVYEVMNGKGLYLLQKETKKKEPIELIIIPAKSGDQVLIPPGYGHITINPSETETLVMNNLVSSKFSSIYDSIKKKRGAAYLYHSTGSWIRNQSYKQNIIVKEKEPAKITNKPFYHSFLENPDEWKFLNEPWLKDNWL